MDYSRNPVLYCLLYLLLLRTPPEDRLETRWEVARFKVQQLLIFHGVDRSLRTEVRERTDNM